MQQLLRREIGGDEGGEVLPRALFEDEEEIFAGDVVVSRLRPEVVDDEQFRAEDIREDAFALGVGGGVALQHEGIERRGAHDDGTVSAADEGARERGGEHGLARARPARTHDDAAVDVGEFFRIRAHARVHPAEVFRLRTVHLGGVEIGESEPFRRDVARDAELLYEGILRAFAQFAVAYAAVAATGTEHAGREVLLGVARSRERVEIGGAALLCTAFAVSGAAEQALVQGIDIFAVRFRDIGQGEGGGFPLLGSHLFAALCRALFVKHFFQDLARHRSSSSRSSMLTIADLISSSV